jgi:hypothetical protein
MLQSSFVALYELAKLSCEHDDTLTLLTRLLNLFDPQLFAQPKIDQIK